MIYIYIFLRMVSPLEMLKTLNPKYGHEKRILEILLQG